jgi:hypothetical protein
MRKTISVRIEESLEPVTDSVASEYADAEYVAPGGTE